MIVSCWVPGLYSSVYDATLCRVAGREVEGGRGIFDVELFQKKQIFNNNF